ncbi:MAG: hypothetical protein FRX48_03389 [Lasallia pustulata]|uniref:Protein kinase-like domain n=1 Tax=Lasallia pustulata TaxID=136370 RepID=A0A5M8PTP4_9LECA|nr:MAG: hypothetical protein FRX48_03389 [Lasallia pustulata]
MVRVATPEWQQEDGQWALGGSMLCERIADSVSAPSDAITTWKDGQGVDYCLRLTTRLPVPPYDDDNAPATPWNRHTAIFEIGCDVLIKVKYMAANERSTEAEAVQKLAPSVPVPEAIHFWHDKELERIFIITRRLHGKMLDDLWHSLKHEDHKQVAKELAAYKYRLQKSRHLHFRMLRDITLLTVSSYHTIAIA